MNAAPSRPLGIRASRVRRVLGTRARNRRSLGTRSGRRRLMLILGFVGATVLAFAGARAAVEGDFFRVREVTFHGLVHARPAVLLAEAGLVRGRTLFDDLSVAEAGLLRDPLVRRVRIRREFPSRLVVEVEERTPVAYWAEPNAGGDAAMRPLDAEGRVLPLDPAHFGWDLPILMVPERSEGSIAIEAGRLIHPEARALLRLLLGIKTRVPDIARRISVAELRPEGMVAVHLMGAAEAEAGEVRLRLETPLEKVVLLPHVIRDLELKGLSFKTLDLSFNDQIVVRPLESRRDEQRPEGSPSPEGGTAAEGRPLPPRATGIVDRDAAIPATMPLRVGET